MIDLGLNQYKISEIKYEVKEGKTVIFKLRNFNLEDVEIVETSTDIEYTDPQKECKCEKKCSCNDKTYEIDKKIIDEHIEEEENKKAKKIERLSNVDRERCKELMKALDAIPYKILGKIGELRTGTNGEGIFLTEPDPYVINDERELSKVAKGLEEMRKKYNCDTEKEELKEICKLNEDEKATLTAAKDKEWKESVKTDKIRPNPIIVNANLDDKYKGMTTGEKREVSKKIIDEDAKKDATVIKERVKNAIGRNTPLSEELINAPK